MYNNYYNPNAHGTYPYYYPSSPAYYPTQQQRQTPAQAMDNTQGELPMEQSYIENILRLNRGKKAVVHMTFSNNPKTFTGIIEEAGRDHIIIKEQQSEKRQLLLMVYLDYITFEEKINYEYPFDTPAGMLSNYPSR